MMEALDPETEQPYYFNVNDIERTLAIKYGVLDTDISNPSWFAAEPPAPLRRQQPARQVKPPRRSDEPRGPEGQQMFREKRRVWYEKKRGAELEGSVASQVKQADK